MIAEHGAPILDPEVAALVGAKDAAEEDRLIRRLAERYEPVIRRIVRRKTCLFARAPRGQVTREEELAEDLAGDALLRMLEELHRQVRACRAAAAPGDGGRPHRPIRSLDGFVRVLARNRVHEHLRERYRERARLRDRVEYVVERYLDPRTRTPAFARWAAHPYELCGFLEWLGRRILFHNRRYQQYLQDAQAFAREGAPNADLSAFLRPPGSAEDDGQGAAVRLVTARDIRLPPLLGALFRWLNSPVDIDHLVGGIARLYDLDGQPENSLDQPRPETGEPALVQVRDAAPSPEEQSLRPEEERDQIEKVRSCWACLRRLSKKQCAALLLGLADHRGEPVIDLFPRLGVATLEELAQAAGMKPARIAAIWPELPLDDRAIGRELGCSSGAVAALRFNARKNLRTMLESAGSRRGGAGPG